MNKCYCILQYYLKGLSPDCFRYISGALKDLKNSYYDRRILDADNYKKQFGLNDAQYDFLREIVYWEYENINRYLIKHQRYPLFNTENLEECIKKRDELLIVLTEKECMEKYNVSSFDDFKNEEFINDLTTSIEVYINNPLIIKALQYQMAPHENLLSGIFKNNVYKFINAMLVYEGKKTLFDDANNKDNCKVKRKELLKLLPKKECLKYLNVLNESELDKYNTKPLIMEIEKYVKCYGQDLSNTPFRYHVGTRLYMILDSSTSNEEKKRYIIEANRINGSILFDNPNDVDGCVKFINDKLKLVEKE